MDGYSWMGSGFYGTGLATLEKLLWEFVDKFPSVSAGSTL